MASLPRLIISATRGGLGKTTITLGITAAWQRAGRRIAAFKKGPDFIDAGWLGVAAKGSCYNLDPFMMSQDAILHSFRQHSNRHDVAIIEGNRGIHDGVDETGTYSTAKLSTLLNAPVFLIVDCTKATSTVAAVVLGCKEFDSSVVIGGVILNHVSSSRHEGVIRRAVAQSSGLPVIGAIPRQHSGEFPERHMGLTPFQEHPEVEAAIDSAAALVEKYIDLGALWEIAVNNPKQLPEPSVCSGFDTALVEGESVVIGVVRDRAFQFYYPDNIEALVRRGAVIQEVDAMHDAALPADLDALYIGGGFPETNAHVLSANREFCASIKHAAESGLPIYAECGGLMFLGRSIKVNDKIFPMTSVFPIDFVLERKPQAHGYTIIESLATNPFFGAGITVRGHEFHYSRVVDSAVYAPSAYQVHRGRGIDGRCDGVVHKNVVAAYTHIHAAATPEWASVVVAKARQHRQAKKARYRNGSVNAGEC